MCENKRTAERLELPNGAYLEKHFFHGWLVYWPSETRMISRPLDIIDAFARSFATAMQTQPTLSPFVSVSVSDAERDYAISELEEELSAATGLLAKALRTIAERDCRDNTIGANPSPERMANWISLYYPELVKYDVAKIIKNPANGDGDGSAAA